MIKPRTNIPKSLSRTNGEPRRTANLKLLSRSSGEQCRTTNLKLLSKASGEPSRTANLKLLSKANGELSRTIKLITLGCKVNQYETQVIREQFCSLGFKEVSDIAAADICLINTCTVTENADKEALYLIRRTHRQNPRAKIIVTGCLAQLDSKLIKSQEGVARVIKNKDKYKIASQFNDNDINDINANLISDFKDHTRAFLKIQDGCKNYCTYCKVPLVRKSLWSKPITDIVVEARALAGNGFKEIVLTGICLGSYGIGLKKRDTLVTAIKSLEGISGLSRVRLSSIEAGDVTDELINAMAGSRILCPHLHIPIQSGDDQVLKKMNRKYTRQDYLNLIRKVRSRIPWVSVTTDVLVGFPGETRENFMNTVDLVKKVMPLKTHIFPYSPRKATLAYGFRQDIPASEVKERVKYLSGIAEASARDFQRKFCGRIVEVLVEERIEPGSLLWYGHTGNYIRVMVKSKKDIHNQLVRVKLSPSKIA